MTQEEKAKAYDEALKQATKELQTCGSLDCDAARQIFRLFPQLAESEDEWVRRKMIEHFKSKTKETWCNMPVKDIIAYLEKKKEPVVDKEGMYYYLGGKFIYCGYPATEENPYDFAMSHQDKQKEQKPATNNKSEMSDENGHLTEKILVEYGAHAKVRDGKRHCEMEWKEFQRLAHYFYELGKAEQKPAEYDHEMWKNCEANFEGGKKEVIEHPEKYGLCNPAEWSEEDEEMRNLIVAIFEVNHPNGFFKANELSTTDMHGVHTEEIISWLKSLRPSWKPSEEQKEYIRTIKSLIADFIRDKQPEDVDYYQKIYDWLDKQ